MCCWHRAWPDCYIPATTHQTQQEHNVSLKWYKTLRLCVFWVYASCAFLISAKQRGGASGRMMSKCSMSASSSERDRWCRSECE
eukprot:5326598-Amphidinium_carterae.1